MSKRWSYQVIEVKQTWTGLKSDQVQAELNRHGSSGWELVNIIVPGPGYPAQLVFKRES